MGMSGCIFIGMLVSMAVGFVSWVWFGPFAGMLVTSSAFGLGAVFALMWKNQGRV